MNDSKNKDSSTLLHSLQERQKELNCLYRIEEILENSELELDELIYAVIKIIPEGMQFPKKAQAKIKYEKKEYHFEDYKNASKSLSAKIKIQGEEKGEITISYKGTITEAIENLFLKEEEQLIKSIAERLSHVFLYSKLKKIHNKWETAGEKIALDSSPQWRVIVDLLKDSNLKLYIYISRKMLYHLLLNSISEANDILIQTYGEVDKTNESSSLPEDMNQPSRKDSMDQIISFSNDIFDLASKNFSDEYIFPLIRNWIDEEKSRFLVTILENPNSSLVDIINALTRFKFLSSEKIKLAPATEKSIKTSVIRKILSDQMEFIKIAKDNINLEDFFDIIKQILSPSNSFGKLGGKSSGLLLAGSIIKNSEGFDKFLNKIKVPKTWHITSDGLMDFLHYNNLENVYEQKYKDIGEIHLEYPNIIQILKNSQFPPEILRGLKVIIEDFGDCPIIVRSSSLLEDRIGASFSGKYKSLFLANQGSSETKLNALTDAISEVYSSIFGPDPIQYRAERELLDFNEEMAIIIQEVVGTKVGKYFLPSFAGVAFSSNEFRWSPRIKRDDGLIRLVPGLGTRAVDRIAEDYPILIAPKQPGLNVNITPDEVIRYSPKNIDVLNLENNNFETLELKAFLKSYGSLIPGIHNMVSVVKENMIQKPASAFNIKYKDDELVVDFHGFLEGSEFINQMNWMMDALKTKLNTPVDIEFAYDGKNLYLLQCRAQSYFHDSQSVPIPRDIPDEKIIFSGNKYISDGFIPNISHVVYVDPDEYSKLTNLEDLKKIGRIIGKLNSFLPKKQFILLGPGRWGSRGDIKLGVNVTYSDINNTAVLIEIARSRGNFTPELSFGTHFFQDLVEASIRYLPLYPDEKDNEFKEDFFLRSKNILGEIFPEYKEMENVVKVIDIPKNFGGEHLQILMNSDLGEAIAVITKPSADQMDIEKKKIKSGPFFAAEDYWKWRLRMAEQIAANLDPVRFGVKAFYVFGSTKNATAGPCSDIDLLIHFGGNSRQKSDLLLWLDGWSLTLSELNYQRTGYKTEGLLDIHLITDKEITEKNSFAVKINAVTDSARQLKMKESDV